MKRIKAYDDMLSFSGFLARTFPGRLVYTTVLLVLTSALNAASVLLAAPLTDFVLHPDLKDISPITEKCIRIMEAARIDVTLVNLLVFLVLCITAASLLNLHASHSINKTRYVVHHYLLAKAFESFFRSQWHFHAKTNRGLMMNTFTQEVGMVGYAFRALATFIASSLETASYLVIPFVISWRVTSICLLATFVCMLPTMWLATQAFKFGSKVTHYRNRLSSAVKEALDNAKLIIGYGREKEAVKRINTEFVNFRDADVMSFLLTNGVPVLFRPFSFAVLVVAVLASRKFELPISDTLVLIASLYLFATSSGQLARQKNSIFNYLPSYTQVRNFMEESSSGSVPLAGKRLPPSLNVSIRASQVSYAYPGRGFSLQDINMVIPRNSIIAITGKSGSGKTTMGDILMGIIRPDEGGILMDDLDLREVDLQEYRTRVGYVIQDAMFFNGSIRENLLWSAPSADENRLLEACRQAYAMEFIERMPQGLDTLIGDNGIQLSGGERQRLALARALVRRPILLILDEATSSLDGYSDSLIQKAVEDASKDTTIVIIAHRLATIKNAHHIYFLEKGRIVEEGAFQDLMKMNRQFAVLAGLQQLSAADGARPASTGPETC